jgi:CubicO group peptidase (beta-lactamase class C family)
MRSIVFSIIAVIASLVPANAQAQQIASLNQLMEQIRARYQLPALAGAIVTPDKITAIGVAGVRARGTSVPVTIYDKWHMGSCTKAMTATMIARLVEDGRLTWGTTLEQIFGANHVHPDLRPATVRQLLGHRAGFKRDAQWPSTQYNEAATLRMRRRQAVTQEALRTQPAHLPGTTFLYSNLGYVIAGHIAEFKTGVPWESLMVEGVFRKLKMRDSGFGPPGHNYAVQATGHDKDGNPARRSVDAVVGPAGTIYCTLSDWARFIAEHLKGPEGESNLLSKERFNELHEPLEGQSYALGWDPEHLPAAGGKVLGHRGSNAFWLSIVKVALNKDFAVMAVTNIGGDNAQKAVEEATREMMRLHLKSEQGKSEAPSVPPLPTPRRNNP